MTSDDNLFTVVALSTGHVPKAVADVLDGRTSEDWHDLIVISPWSYGWWIWVNVEEHFDDLPECLKRCMTYAHERGARWIQFDCDNAYVECLPLYEW